MGYPELASAPGPYHPETGFGVKDTVVNPAREETYAFLEAFFQEMAALFPDTYIHIGGDENNGKQWLANPEIQGFMRANNLSDPHSLQAYFNRRLHAILTKLNKKMVGWDEILDPDLPASTIVIQAWRNKESLWQAAKMGYKGILSHGYYLDLMQPTALHYQNDPLAEADQLTPEEQQHILGGEAAMWTEFISPETIDARIWPRAAAIAERLWSPAAHCTLEGLDDRLAMVSLRLEELGLTHIKNYPMMLRRLCGSMEIDALKTLVDLCEPVKNYERTIQCPEATIYSPLTRVVDAAPAEAQTARKFHKLVRAFLSTLEPDPKASAMSDKYENLHRAIKAQLSLWQQNHAALEPVIQSAPLLTEIQSLSADLARIAGLGLDLLTFWDKWQNNEPLNLDSAFYQKQKDRLRRRRKTPRPSGIGGNGCHRRTGGSLMANDDGRPVPAPQQRYNRRRSHLTVAHDHEARQKAHAQNLGGRGFSFSEEELETPFPATAKGVYGITVVSPFSICTIIKTINTRHPVML